MALAAAPSLTAIACRRSAFRCFVHAQIPPWTQLMVVHLDATACTFGSVWSSLTHTKLFSIHKNGHCTVPDSDPWECRWGLKTMSYVRCLEAWTALWQPLWYTKSWVIGYTVFLSTMAFYAIRYRIHLLSIVAWSHSVYTNSAQVSCMHEVALAKCGAALPGDFSFPAPPRLMSAFFNSFS